MKLRPERGTAGYFKTQWGRVSQEEKKARAKALSKKWVDSIRKKPAGLPQNAQEGEWRRLRGGLPRAPGFVPGTLRGTGVRSGALTRPDRRSAGREPGGGQGPAGCASGPPPPPQPRFPESSGSSARLGAGARGLGGTRRERQGTWRPRGPEGGN